MRWTAPQQRYRDVPIGDNDDPAASYILAFSEGQILANTRRQPESNVVFNSGTVDTTRPNNVHKIYQAQLKDSNSRLEFEIAIRLVH